MKKINCLFLFTSFISFAQWNQLGADIDGLVANEQSGTSNDLNADGTVLIVGAPRALDNGIMKGKARVYEWNGTNWIQRGDDLIGTNQGDVFGEAVSISSDGNTIAIGAPGFLNPSYLGPTGPTGYTRIFEWNGTSWIQKGADVDSDNTNASFGSTLSLDAAGTTFIAGGYSFVNGALGFVKIYTWNGSNWVQKGQTILGDNPSDFLGTDVDINEDGSIIAVGSVTGNANGYARVLKFIGNSWVPQGSDVLGETLNDQFGRSVSLSANGSILAAGTPYNDGNGNNAGHVRVFENSTLSTSSFTRNTISIYPNPSSDYIEVTGLTSPDTYIIYSVLGTKISSGTISSNQKIDIQNYSTGVYFLKLENEEVLKFIKN
jgi:hypothetical protein